MGWRDLLEAAAEEVDFGTLGYDGPAQLLLAMPAADRIALARELLAGTEMVVARDVAAKPSDDWGDEVINAYADGWNACRAAMMEGEE